MFSNFGKSICQFITYQHPDENVRLIGSLLGAFSFGSAGAFFGEKIYIIHYRVSGSNHNSKYSERFKQAFKNFLAGVSGQGGMMILGIFLGFITGKYPVILIPAMLLGIPAINAF